LKFFKKKNEPDHEQIQTNLPILMNNSQIDEEFINPVDKQIAMFQMSSPGIDVNKNSNDSSSSSSSEEEEDEDDEPSILDKKRDENILGQNLHDSENKSYSYSNSKKILNQISNLDSVSLDVSTSSSSTKRGIRGRT